MTDSGHYDLIIIGTGAGGGTLAHALAPSGKRILLLERGRYVPREKENWSSEAVNLAARYHTQEVWRDKAGKELHPHTNYNVGGNTKFYGAALFRLRQEDFAELQHHGGDLASVAHHVRRTRTLLRSCRAALSRARRTRHGSDRSAREHTLSISRGLARTAHPAAPRRLRRRWPSAVSRTAWGDVG